VKPLISLRSALRDPDLFAKEFGSASWLGWRALLLGMLGEALTVEERQVFQTLTARTREPLRRVEQFWGAIGRRGGKSRAISLLITYIATLCDHRGNLSIGERGLVLTLAQNTRQAKIVFGYVAALIESIPPLAKMIVNKTADTISLTNGIDIEIRAASFRGLRGVTCVCACLDEITYFYDESLSSSNFDQSIIDSILPTLSTTNGILICIGSPHARRGAMWSNYQKHFGDHGDPLILVAQGATRDLNQTLPQSVVDRALEQDEAVARAEYLGCFRSDLEAYVSREQLEPCIAAGVLERPPMSDTVYEGFLDPASGSGSDDMAICLGHKQGEMIVLDVIRSRHPPFSPRDVVEEFSALLASYRCQRITSDRWGGEFVREPFRERNISVELAERPKSDLYRDLIPLINSRRIELLDHKKMIAQLLGLERRTARGTGKDLIDHGPGANAHDDLGNCCAGVAYVLANGSTYWRDNLNWVHSPEDDEAMAKGPPVNPKPPPLWRHPFFGGQLW
jgi:hypothetical protein